MKIQDLPLGPPRSFTAAGLAADLDCVAARPGYSLAAGGPALTSNASHETRDMDALLPALVRWDTDGSIKMRFNFGVCPEGTGAGSEMYYDATVAGLAGQMVNIAPDFVIDVGTDADFTLFWPKR